MKKTTSIRISEDAKVILEKLAKKWGVSKTAVLELIVRQAAEREGLR